jgi:hypothetical protein
VSGEYGEPGYATLENRASDGRCIVCNLYVNAYYCTACAINSHYEGGRVLRSQQPSVTATAVSAAEYEQLSALWSCVDSSAEVFASSEDIRISREVVRKRLGRPRIKRRQTTTYMTSKRWERWWSVFLRTWERIGQRAAPRLISYQRRSDGQRFGRFCRVWHSVGWAALDDMTRPG